MYDCQEQGACTEKEPPHPKQFNPRSIGHFLNQSEFSVAETKKTTTADLLV